MRKDGTVFIVATILLSVMAGSFVAVIGSLFVIGCTYGILKVIVTAMNNKEPMGWQTANEVKTVGYRFDTLTVPTDLQRMKSVLIQNLSYTDNASYDTVINRFLTLIKVPIPPGQRPDYLFDVIVKKMMWEFRNKYGITTVPQHFKDYLTIDEVIKPIEPQDLQRFHNFCMQNQ